MNDDDGLILAVGDMLRVIRGQDEGLMLQVTKITPDAIEVVDSGGTVGVILHTGLPSIVRVSGGPPDWYHGLMTGAKA